MQDQHRFNTKAWLLWTAGFLAFPIGGALATAATGRVNDLGSALLGGLVVGAVIGTGQWLVARPIQPDWQDGDERGEDLGNLAGELRGCGEGGPRSGLQDAPQRRERLGQGHEHQDREWRGEGLSRQPRGDLRAGRRGKPLIARAGI